jgi:hypothetical protein
MANIGIAVPAVQPWGAYPRELASLPLPPLPLSTRAVNLRPVCPGSQGHHRESGGLITLTLTWRHTLKKKMWTLAYKWCFRRYPARPPRFSAG